MNEYTNQDVGQMTIVDQSSLVTDDFYDDLGGGIASSFPVISYRNSRWRIRWQGVEELLVDEQNRSVEEIGVCLVRVPNHKSKRYWVRYEQGSNNPPDCWSNDSIRPHPSLVPPAQPQNWPHPQPTTCAQCYWDQFNTAVRQDGSLGRGKACADYKRCVVKVYYPALPPGFEGAEGMLMLLQVPPDSLQTIKAYGAELAKQRVAAAATATFVGMVLNDKDISYPKLTFRKGPSLSDEEIVNIRMARNSEEASRILNEEVANLDPGVVDAGNGEDGQAPQQAQAQAQPQPAPAPAPQPQARPQQAAPPRPQLQQTAQQPIVPQQQRAPQPQPQAPQPQRAAATGMPPQPQRAAAAPQAPQQAAPQQQVQQQRVSPAAPPAQPAARAINPMAPTARPMQPTQGTINAAVRSPAPPPPSNRPLAPPPRMVREQAPPPVQEEYSDDQQMAASVEDEMDQAFTNLAQQGVIQQE